MSCTKSLYDRLEMFAARLKCPLVEVTGLILADTG